MATLALWFQLATAFWGDVSTLHDYVTDAADDADTAWMYGADDDGTCGGQL